MYLGHARLNLTQNLNLEVTASRCGNLSEYDPIEDARIGSDRAFTGDSWRSTAARARGALLALLIGFRYSRDVASS